MIALTGPPPATVCAPPIVVGVADCRVSRFPVPSLATYALGSCIAVTVFDPGIQAGGILHLMLPEASLDPARAASNPFCFADTGVPALLRDVCRQGAHKQRLRVSISGGAQILNETSMYHTGKKNYLAVRKVLWKAGVMVEAEAIGGYVSRTVLLDLRTGAVTLRVPGQADFLLLEAGRSL